MTEQQQHDRDHLRASAAKGGQWGAVVLALLDQLDKAETELDPWMARAYEAEGKLWKAEARIKAVRDVLDAVDGDYDSHGAHRLGVTRRIRRALEG